MVVATEVRKKTRQEILDAKKARNRARRHENKAVSDIYKPIEEWDDEELARGRPRDKNGNFTGRGPKWVPRAVYEEAVRRFTEIAQSDLRALVPEAIICVERLILNNEVDRRGRPVVAASVKLDAAKWVVEHLVGKPTQRVEADISVRLQSLLANVLVSPENEAEMRPAIEAHGWDTSDADEDDSESERD